VSLYVSFVYIREALVASLTEVAPEGSTAKKCAAFLTSDSVKALRNAVAHGNWRVDADRGVLEYWARTGSISDKKMAPFTVTGSDLDFWQAVARCTAYASYLAVDEATCRALAARRLRRPLIGGASDERG